MLLFIVAIGWLLVLASWLRSRTEGRGVNSISSFSRHLSVLERTSPARPTIGMGPAADGGPRRAPLTVVGNGHVPGRSLRPATMSLRQARRRRRDVLVALVAATALFGVLALVVGAVFGVLFLLTGGALGAYVVLLARAQRIGAEREAKVRYLPAPAPVDTTTGYWLQQSGS